MRSLPLLLPFCVLLTTACQRTNDRASSTPRASVITTPDAPLRETRWVLRELTGQSIVATAANAQPPYLRITDAGTAEGSGSCNRFRGGLKPATDDGELQFTPLVSTRVACPTLDTEQKFTQALDATRTYRISGDTLLLYASTGRQGTPLARLEAVYLR